MSWQLPPEYIAGYLAACKKAATDDEAFKVFRREPHITTIIENGNEEIAAKTALKLISWHGIDWMQNFFLNDEVGSPATCEGVSPTTLRYVYICTLIEKLIEGGLYSLTLTEIGGGYGGLCSILSKFNHPETYRIYDLPEVQQLQKRFLDELDITNYELPESIDDKPCDLLIAWCSWSELDLETRKSYLPMIANARHILFCCNYNYAEDLELLRSVHPDVKEYSDNLYTNIIYK